MTSLWNNALNSMSRMQLIDLIKYIASKEQNGLIDKYFSEVVKLNEDGLIEESSFLLTKATKERRRIDLNKYPSRKIALKIMYDGSSYNGLVIQDHDDNTVEHYLFTALKSVKLIDENLNGIDFSRVGRTDKSVSATSQIVSLRVRSKLSEISNYDQIKGEISFDKILNKHLPNSIRVLAWSPVHDSFNARYDCLYRTYRYHFSGGARDVMLMKEACKMFEGFHDFSNFSKFDPMAVQKFEINLDSFNIFNVEGERDSYYAEITSKSFLWHQVRSMMAILLLVGEGKEKKDVISRLFDTKANPSKPIYNLAPPEPLCLFDVGYKEIDPEGKKTFNWNFDQESVKQIVSHFTQQSVNKSPLWLMREIAQMYVKEEKKEKVEVIEVIEKGEESVVQKKYNKRREKKNQYIPLFSRNTCKPYEDRKIAKEMKDSRRKEINKDNINKEGELKL